jgi:hypothetical protein
MSSPSSPVLTPVKLTRQENVDWQESKRRGPMCEENTIEKTKENDFETAKYYMDLAKFYSTKHQDEYTGDLEYLSLTNEPMEIETNIECKIKYCKL